MSEYRYLLEHDLRDLGSAAHTRKVLFIGAHAELQDTIERSPLNQRYRALAQANGFSRMVIGNVFPLRMVSFKGQADRRVAAGIDNIHVLQSAMRNCAAVVICWGDQRRASKPLRAQFHIVRCMLKLHDGDIHVLGFTQSGDPLSADAVGRSTRFQKWVP